MRKLRDALSYIWLQARNRALAIIQYWKGVLEMMAMLFACRVIEGRTTFEQVPRLLKQQTADVLVVDFGVPEIVPVEFGGTLGRGDPGVSGIRAGRLELPRFYRGGEALDARA